MPGLGDEFRAAREARRLSLSDVSEQIHIRSVYLQGIEDEEWSSIGAPVYVRGFIRAYARFLGIDPEPGVEAFNATLGRPSVGAAPSDYRNPAATRRPGPSPWLWAAAIVAAVLVGFVGYSLFALRGGEPAPASATAGSRPTAAATHGPLRRGG